jgi:HEAT repeat protein
VELLSSQDAHGDLMYSWGLLTPRKGNVALFALSAMGAHASPAIPTVLKLLDMAGDDLSKDILTCLAKIGPAAQASRPAVRQALKSESAETRLTAAAALLCIFPGDAGASAILKSAMKSSDNEVRKKAADLCFQLNVREKDLIPQLIALLRDREEEVRRSAAWALSVFGPAAGDAIPALENMLINEQQSFLPRTAAAVCLKEIGKASLPALIRVARNKEAPGRGEAVVALGSFPQDTPLVMPVLMKGLEDEAVLFHAVIALGKLGKEARQARFSLLLRCLWVPFDHNRRHDDWGYLAHWAFQQVN